MEPKTIDDVLRLALSVFPNASIEEDNEGQLVIYTGIYQNPDGSLGNEPTCEE